MYNKKTLSLNFKISNYDQLISSMKTNYIFFFEDMFFSYSEYLYIKKYFKIAGIFFQRLKSFDIRVLLYCLYESILYKYSYIVLISADGKFIENFKFFYDFLINNDKMNFVSNKNSKKLQRYGNIMFNLKFMFMYYKQYIYSREYIAVTLDIFNKFRFLDLDILKVCMSFYVRILLSILNFYQRLFKNRFCLLISKNE